MSASLTIQNDDANGGRLARGIVRITRNAGNEQTASGRLLVKLTLGHTSYGHHACLSCGKNIDLDSNYGPPWDPLPPGHLVALFAQRDEGYTQIVGYLCPECARSATVDARRVLLRGGERLRSLATGSEVIELAAPPTEEDEELINELVRRVIEQVDQERLGYWVKGALITPLIGSGRMYSLCREAAVEDPLEMVALGLVSYKDMQPDKAMRFVEDQELEIVELADAMDETASQEELSERVIQILKRWTQRREDEQGSA
jgi:hypothetical protein